jgi:hypothetical protein
LGNESGYRPSYQKQRLHCRWPQVPYLLYEINFVNSYKATWAFGTSGLARFILFEYHSVVDLSIVRLARAGACKADAQGWTANTTQVNHLLLD